MWVGRRGGGMAAADPDGRPGSVGVSNQGCQVSNGMIGTTSVVIQINFDVYPVTSGGGHYSPCIFVSIYCRSHTDTTPYRR